MKLSRETLAILKNFSGINPNLSIKPGNKMATVSSGKNIIAEATVTEDFEHEFGIYDLSEFLGVMSLFDSPDLEFSGKYVTMKEGKNGVKYFSADQSVLTPVPNLKQFPVSDIDFDLPASMLQQIQRVASVLGVPDFSVVGDGDVITINVGDKKNPTGNTFESEIGVTDKEFRVNFKVENLRMMAGDYSVSIGGKKISRFKSTERDLVYYCAVELDSSFEF